jgi:hypothetical protein
MRTLQKTLLISPITPKRTISNGLPRLSEGYNPLRCGMAFLSCLKGIAQTTAVYHSFHLAVYIKAHVLLDQFWDEFEVEDITDLHQTIFSVCNRAQRLGRRESMGTLPRCMHLNFVAACRELSLGMESSDCTQSEEMCVHDRNTYILEALQREALREIAHGVLLATGRHLPTELCLMVFEATLDAEGLPRKWRTRDPHSHEVYGVYLCPKRRQRNEKRRTTFEDMFGPSSS